MIIPLILRQNLIFIWSLANKLWGSYMPDKYGNVIIPVTIIRRFECALESKKAEVLSYLEKIPTAPFMKLRHMCCEYSGMLSSFFFLFFTIQKKVVYSIILFIFPPHIYL